MPRTIFAFPLSRFGRFPHRAGLYRYPHTPLSTMNRIISLLLIIVALAASSVQGFAPSSLGGISGGEFFLVYVVVPKMR